ncbi:MAG: hypothetical protein SOW20_07845 [Berryella intestinalis]|uniref:hypothetical protein n=1 Tax=Berryella intestinalis TaxID=1531429 RepID=UPI002A751858|nr:hypothetical protein [Berryella intestinalis]MDY3129916.1 hypothetical protein [Berryella intestinalis]
MSGVDDIDAMADRFGLSAAKVASGIAPEALQEAAAYGDVVGLLVDEHVAKLAMLTGCRYAPVNECRVDVGDAHIRCRACGVFMRRDGLLDACGPIEPRYCPNCGRRIVWEGERCGG